MQKDYCKCLNFDNHKNFISNKTPELMNSLNIYLACWIKNEDETRRIRDRKEGTLKIKNNSHSNEKREYINFYVYECRKIDELIDEFK
jgi:hypothetical protein